MGFFTRVRKTDPFCRSPSIPLQMKLCQLHRLLAPAPSAIPTAKSPAAPPACWQKGLCGHLPTIPGRNSQVSQYWLFQLAGLFGSFLLRWVWMQLQLQAISSAVAEAALKSAKRGLQGAGAAGRHHLLIWPQRTPKGCSDTRWVSPREPSSN